MWSWAARVPDLNDEFAGLLKAGRVRTCHPVMLELLYSAQSSGDYELIDSGLRRLAVCDIGPREWWRALEVYDALAAQGPKHQRQVSHSDLLIAVAAEAAGVTVLHYDEDFDRITEVSGIATQWVRPRGSLE